MNHPKKSESTDGTGLQQNKESNLAGFDSLHGDLNILDDWARISPIFSIQFSLKKGRLNCEWQPYLPPPKLLVKLAGHKVYFDVRHRFLERITRELGMKILVLDGVVK
jgi:hypothetical protein